MSKPPQPDAVKALLADHWLTTAEACVYLGVRPDWLYEHAKSGDVPSVKIGRLRRFRATELEDWIQQKRNQPNE